MLAAKPHQISTRDAVIQNEAQTTPNKVIASRMVAIETKVPSTSRKPKNVNINVIITNVRKISRGKKQSPASMPKNTVIKDAHWQNAIKVQLVF